MGEQHRVGIQYLEAVTALLQRVRVTHPTAGLYEAADLQWWWRTPRATDDLPQLFWFDSSGRPEAAAIMTDWVDGVSLELIVMPGATPDRVAEVVERGITHASEAGFEAVEIEVDSSDTLLCDLLVDHGFTAGEDGLVETWLIAGARPAISPLHEGYRLSRRTDTLQRPHHMIKRSGPGVETRLRQTSLYRPDLDLLILDQDDNLAAYGLFWFDPTSATGLVEPMRTEDHHQRRGLARHLLTTGVDLLATAGAERIKICYRPDNPAAKNLYLSAGFEPVRQTVIFSGPTNPQTS